MLLKDFLVEVGLANESLDDSEEDVLSDFGGSKFVKKSQFANFLLRNLDLTDYSRGQFNCAPKRTVDRLDRMLTRVFVEGQGAQEDQITPRQLGQGLREKIHLRVPLHAYLHIGVEAALAYENESNQILERIYQFYCQIEVQRSEANFNQDTFKEFEISGLQAERVHRKLNLDGMNFL